MGLLVDVKMLYALELKVVKVEITMLHRTRHYHKNTLGEHV